MFLHVRPYFIKNVNKEHVSKQTQHDTNGVMSDVSYSCIVYTIFGYAIHPNYEDVIAGIYGKKL